MQPKSPRRQVRDTPSSYGRDLGREFRELAASRQPQRRGFVFEDLLAELFRRSAFAVRKSPPSTRPRQSDLLAWNRDLTVIASAKWISKVVGTKEVDDLRIRVLKLSPRPVGCLFSMSGYTPEVPQYAANYRSEAEILVFSQHEIELLFDGAYPLSHLIDDKRAGLKEKGKTCFRTGTPPYQDLAARLDLPEPRSVFEIDSRKELVISVHGHGVGSDLVYAYMLTTSTAGYLGRGVSLNVNLGFASLSELSTFLHRLPSTIGMSPEGMFAIHQTGTTWHGFGMKALLEACRNQKDRYDNAPGERHHREHCIYFGDVRNGWMIVTFQLDAYAMESVAYAELEIRVPGIPTNMKPYEALSRAVGRDAFFEPIIDQTPEIQRSHFGDRGPRLDVLHTITEDGGRLIRGIVAKNPFNAQKIPRPLKGEPDLASTLRGPDSILCTLTDMIERGTMVDYFYVDEIVAIPSALRRPTEIRCTWHQLVGPRVVRKLGSHDLSAALKSAANEGVRAERRRSQWQAWRQS